MKINRKLFAALLALSMMLSLVLPASALDLSGAAYSGAKFTRLAFDYNDRTLDFHNGLLIAHDENYKCGLIDENGNVVLPFEYDGLTYLDNGLYISMLMDENYNIQSNVINAKGETLFAAPAGDYAYKGSDYFYVSHLGEWDPITGEMLEDYYSTYYSFDLKPLDSVIIESYSEAGYTVLYRGVSGTSDYQYALRNDETGETVLDFSEDIIYIWTDENSGESRILAGGKIYDLNLNEIPTAEEYTEVSPYSNFIYVSVGEFGEKNGAVDANGKVLVPLGEYSYFSEMDKDGYIAAVGVSGHSGALFKDGQLIQEYTDKSVSACVDSPSLIFWTYDSESNLNYGLMDKEGNILVPAVYSTIYESGNGQFIAEKEIEMDGWYGYTCDLLDSAGQKVFEESYGELTYIGEDRYLVSDWEHSGIRNGDGSFYLPMQYKNIFVYDGGYYEIYDGETRSLKNFNGETYITTTSGEMVFSLVGDYSLYGATFDQELLKEYGYDGAVVLPICADTPQGPVTCFFSLESASVLDTASGFVSNIDENGVFAYLDPETNLYGVAKLPAAETPVAASSEITVKVGDNAVVWTDAKPFINNEDRTMVPLRAVADALGLQVDWNGETREASFSDGSRTIYFPIDSRQAHADDGSIVEMDTAAVIVNDRTYAPIRYLAEFFGHTVGWDGETRTVLIN